MERQRWQDWLMLLFGAWLFVSPFVLSSTSYTDVAAWDSYILGIAVAIFAVAALADRRVWEEWINLVLGIWLIIAPFLLGFHMETAATANHVVLGILIAGDAIWAMGAHPTRRAGAV